MNIKTRLEPLQARWSSLGERQRTGLSVAMVLVALALLWQIMLAPALLTLRNAETQGRTLDAQLQQMQALQKQAQAFKAQPTLGYEEALRTLTSATQQTLGASAEISVTAERARVMIKGASADNLARWLAQARLNARSLPLQAQLQRTTLSTGTVWSGVMVMSLPAH